MPPLGDRPWLQVPGPLFPARALYIVEGTNPPALVTPAPFVRLGGRTVRLLSGETMQVGDVEVASVYRADFPLTRLQAAAGFHLDAPSGDLFTFALETLEDAGASTWRFCLNRVTTYAVRLAFQAPASVNHFAGTAVAGGAPTYIELLPQPLVSLKRQFRTRDGVTQDVGDAALAIAHGACTVQDLLTCSWVEVGGAGERYRVNEGEVEDTATALKAVLKRELIQP